MSYYLDKEVSHDGIDVVIKDESGFVSNLITITKDDILFVLCLDNEKMYYKNTKTGNKRERE